MFFRIHVFPDPRFLGSRFFRVQVFQDPGFSGSKSSVRVQVLEVASSPRAKHDLILKVSVHMHASVNMIFVIQILLYRLFE